LRYSALLLGLQGKIIGGVCLNLSLTSGVLGLERHFASRFLARLFCGFTGLARHPGGVALRAFFAAAAAL
jgi:hypothetical protein